MIKINLQRVEQKRDYTVCAICIFLLAVFVGRILLAGQPSPVAFGGTERNDKLALTIQDFGSFQPGKETFFGVRRYGFGTGSLELGRIAAISAKSRNGITVYAPQGLFQPHIGLQLISGDIRVNTAPVGNNYYLWQPGVDVGLISIPLGIMANVKVGRIVTNYNLEKGWGPHQNYFTGYSVNAKLLGVAFNYDVTKFSNLERKIYDVQVFNRLHLQHDVDRLNKQYMIVWRADSL